MLVSITIPVYNDAEGLRRSLRSLIGQSYANWEAIVVDDGSRTSLIGVVKEFNDERIVFFRLETNQGRPVARQKTFELMRGDYCGFLDAGDFYEKDYIRNALEHFKKHSLLGVSQSMKITYKDKIYRSEYDNKLIDIQDEAYNRISFASTVFVSEICKEYRFNSKLKYSQDRHFLNYLAKKNQGFIYTLNSGCYVYNQGSNMKLSTTFWKYIYDSLRLYREHEYINSILSVGKAISMSMVHLVFGYEKILGIRFKK